MIRFIAQKADGTALYFIGLEHENLDRMKAGNPVFIDAGYDLAAHPEDIALRDVDIVIFTGANSYEMVEELRKEGLDVLAAAERVAEDKRSPFEPPEDLGKPGKRPS